MWPCPWCRLELPDGAVPEGAVPDGDVPDGEVPGYRVEEKGGPDLGGPVFVKEDLVEGAVPVPDDLVLLTDGYGDGPVGNGPDGLVGAVPVPGDAVLLTDGLEGAVPEGVLLCGKTYTPPVDVGRTGIEDSVPGGGTVLEEPKGGPLLGMFVSVKLELGPPEA